MKCLRCQAKKLERKSHVPQKATCQKLPAKRHRTTCQSFTGNCKLQAGICCFHELSSREQEVPHAITHAEPSCRPTSGVATESRLLEEEMPPFHHVPGSLAC